MKLAEYLSANKVTQAAFAHRIGRSVASVSRIAAGLQKPDLDTLLAIEAATGRKVLARDFADDESGEKAPSDEPADAPKNGTVG